MKTQLQRNWWLLLLNGIFLLIFGLLAVFNPGLTLKLILFYMGILLLVSGVFFIAGAIYRKGRQPTWGGWLVTGVIDLVMGLLFVFYTELVLQVIVIIFGLWIVVIGLFQVITYINLKDNLPNKYFHLITGILALLFGVLLIINPFEGGNFLTILVGISSLVFGGIITMIALGWKGKKQA